MHARSTILHSTERDWLRFRRNNLSTREKSLGGLRLHWPSSERGGDTSIAGKNTLGCRNETVCDGKKQRSRSKSKEKFSEPICSSRKFRGTGGPNIKLS